MSPELTPPEPGKRLYAEVFAGKSTPLISATVADGIRAIIGNVERILNDLNYLRADGRIARARLYK